MAEDSAYEELVATRSPLIRPIVLPVFKGLPISGYQGNSRSARGMQDSTAYDLVRWLGLMRLANNPQQLQNENSALSIATQYVAEEQWDEFFECMGQCLPRAGMLNSMNAHALARQWQGANEFERSRSHQAFLASYTEVLLSEAVKPPFDMYVAIPVRLETYSAERGGMPLAWNLQGVPHPVDQRQAGQKAATHRLSSIPLTSGHTASINAEIPLVLPCDIATCESFLADVQSRTVHALFKVRVKEVADMAGRTRVGEPQTELIGPVVFHKTARLESPFYSFVNRPSKPVRVFTAGTSSDSMQPSDTGSQTLAVASTAADEAPEPSTRASKAMTPGTPATVSSSAQADGAFDPDILGIRLGMAMEEADGVARNHLSPDLVYRLQTENPAQGYQSGRFYVSHAQAEAIILLATADGRVAGIDRRLVLPAHAPRNAIREQIVQKYGEPKDEKPSWRWWNGTPDDTCNNMGPQTTRAELVEGPEPPRPESLALLEKLAIDPVSAVSISYGTRPGDPGQGLDYTTCAPILMVGIDQHVSPANGEGLLQILLFDHGQYVRAQAKAAKPTAPAVQVKL